MLQFERHIGRDADTFNIEASVINVLAAGVNHIIHLAIGSFLV
jgi:hypothetical protein